MQSQKLSMGETCEEFEKKLSNYQEVKHSVLFNSGSSANLALLQASLNLGLLKTGDKVVFSSLTWATNVMPIIQLGLIPVPVDIELETLNVSLEKFQQVVKDKKIKCLFITNLLGFCSDLAAIRDFCRENQILLLEDNCESFGSEHQNTKLGNFGLGSTFSFFVGHHLSAIEGGAVCTNDFKFYEMLKMVRAHGWTRNVSEQTAKKLKIEHSIDAFYDLYTFYELAYNLRPTEITGFIGAEQIRYAKSSVDKRQENYFKFHEASLKNPDLIHLNIKNMNKISNFAFPLVFKSHDAFNSHREFFENNDIEIRPIVGGDMTLQPFYKKHVNASDHMPNAALAHRNGFYLPNNPELTDDEINTMCKLIAGNTKK